MQREEFYQLFDKFKAGECTPDEIAFIESWYLIYEEFDNHDLTLADRKEDLDKVWGQLKIISQKKQISIWPRVIAAASILLFLSTGGYYLHYRQKKQPQIAQNKMNDIPPGGNKAILTLSNGRQISLNNAQNGKLVNQGNTIIRKTAIGQIVYTAVAANVESAPTQTLYNTMTTPKGGQYLVILPDGSKVLLNAASSLRYPTAFTGKERKVELSGEAYFEVVHNAALPFRVVVADQVVEDLGTHFNINAYQDEHLIKTTLIEGGVNISVKNHHVILKPGQQATLNIDSTDQNIKVIENANVEEATAWKNGYFRFNNEKIPEIMRQLSRWYNVDIVYKGNITNDGLNGKISRFKNISQVLQMLESTKLVHFKVAGKEVTVIE
jgi:transmembrane sensor